MRPARSRVVSTAPVAPIGWPWAIAPPSTFTTSSGQAELADAREGDRGKGLVDLDALEVADRPPRELQSLAHGGNGRDSEVTRLHGGDAEGHDAREGGEAVGFGELAGSHDHRGRAAVEPGRPAGSWPWA